MIETITIEPTEVVDMDMAIVQLNNCVRLLVDGATHDDDDNLIFKRNSHTIAHVEVGGLEAKYTHIDKDIDRAIEKGEKTEMIYQDEEFWWRLE